jgi:tripartite-type tricarboxylate transporter receptor subunit TctC
MVDLASAKAFIAAGKIRGIAIASLQRAQALPDVATFHEQGFSNFESSAWQAVVASPATPADLRASFHAALHAALANPALKQRLESLGVETLPTTPEQMTSYTRAERARWGEIIRKHSIRID